MLISILLRDENRLVFTFTSKLDMIGDFFSLIKVECLNDATIILKTYRNRLSVKEFLRIIKQDIGTEKIMVMTLMCINKLIEIAMLAYAIAFKILMIDHSEHCRHL